MRNIPTDIFKLNTIKLPVEAGSLIVAEPFLSETYFNHAVIAIIEHNEDNGSMGVVLNNPSGYTLDELIENVEIDQTVPVYCGGPMSLDRLYFVHTLGDRIFHGASEFGPGLWIGGDFDAVLGYVNSGYQLQGCLRFFLGYSGWSPRQLESEIEQSVWAVAGRNYSPRALLESNGDSMWHRTVSAMGSPYRSWLLHPRDIHAN